EFNAEISLTQHIESINAIIHKYINSHSTLLDITSSSTVHVFLKLVNNLRNILTDEGLIQEVKLSNINSVNNQDQKIIYNPLQANAKRKPSKRLKLSGKIISKESIEKVNNVHVRSRDRYMCCNCFKDEHNA
ncbi:11277_t:CDS:2, partial [Funneliformis geosporum]